MAKDLTKRFHDLSAKVDGHLQQFSAGDEPQEFISGPTGEGLAPENYIGARVKRKKRRKALVGAGAAVGGTAAVAGVSRLKPVRKKVRGWAGAGASRVQKAAGDANMTAVQTGSRKLMRKGKMLGKLGRGLRKVATSFEAGTKEQQLEGGSRKKKAAAGAAAVGVAGAGAYGGKKLRQAAINHGGVVDDMGNQVAVKGMYKRGAKKAKSALKGRAGTVAAKLKNSKAGGQLMRGLRKVGGRKGKIIAGVAGGVGAAGAGVAIHRRQKQKNFSAKEATQLADQIVLLESRIAEMSL